jgi:hypothetical protein
MKACDFCHSPLAEPHQHLLEPATRKLECVCEACAILFSNDRQKYRRVPRCVRFLPAFYFTDTEWDALAIPIGIAFFLRSSTADRVIALYPGPAGPVESLLSLESWAALEEKNPLIQAMESDIEGLLVYRAGPEREHYIIPIDEFFKLIGLIRLKWRGFNGGTDVWQEVEQFRKSLKERSVE